MIRAEELKDWRTKYGFASPKDRLKIYYSPLAFAKTIMLVAAHPVEVGWNMVIKPYENGYKVEDIVVYPQKVSAAYISVDTGNWGLWKATLNDDIEANLNGHGHSHVNMSTFASIVDENQQHDEVLTKNKGFYFFQIWNKRNEINSFFYDIDNKVFYTVNDIDIIIEGAENFVNDSVTIVRGERIWANNYEVGEGFESEQII